MRPEPLPMTPTSRRQFLQTAIALGLLRPFGLFAAANPPIAPIADTHSHLGFFSRKLNGGSLKAMMEEAGVTLLAWSIVADARWIRRTSSGIDQWGTPGAPEQAAYFRERLAMARQYLEKDGLAYARGPEDIDAARAGRPCVVIASEGAGFLEEDPALLDKLHADGLRHLQLVHYIHNAIGDFQTRPPQHHGLTVFGERVIAACNRLGILVDLAHCESTVVERALEVSTVPMIWSHSALMPVDYALKNPGRLSRLLRLDLAKKIAAKGGAVGLWALRASVRDSPEGYATELMNMADAIGPEHVMFGTDIEGLGSFGVMDGLSDLRQVADVLRQRGVDDQALGAICFDNYARCLKVAMAARLA